MTAHRSLKTATEFSGLRTLITTASKFTVIPKAHTFRTNKRVARLNTRMTRQVMEARARVTFFIRRLEEPGRALISTTTQLEYRENSIELVTGWNPVVRWVEV